MFQSISINVPQNYQTWHDVNRSFHFGHGLGLRQCNRNDLDFVCIVILISKDKKSKPPKRRTNTPLLFIHAHYLLVTIHAHFNQKL